MSPTRRYGISIEVDGSDSRRIGVRHDLHQLADLDPCACRPLLASLAADLGLDPEPLLKAEPLGEGEDPRYEYLWRLVRAAARDYGTFREHLVDEVLRILRESDYRPLTEEGRGALFELLKDRGTSFLVQMTGQVPPSDPGALDRLIKRGFVSAHQAEGNYIKASATAGARLDVLGTMDPDAENARATVGQLLDAARRTPLTPQERTAMRYVQMNGAIYMRRPILDAPLSEVERVLNKEEELAVRGALERGVAGRMDEKRLERELRYAVQGNESLTNDFLRVARTEMVFAHNNAASRKLRQECEAAGITDPQVYKLRSPRACRHCVAIWGPLDKPTVYPLLELEHREALGGNFRLPASEWGPTIGPVHPNCFPAGVPVLTRRGLVAIEEVRVGDEVLTHRGRWRPVTWTGSRVAHELVSVNGVPVTPEHPFLTPRGWVDAGKLQASDQIVQVVRFEIVPSLIPGDPDHVPSEGGEPGAFHGVLRDLFGRAVPVSSVHLDTDPCLREGQIHVVPLNGEVRGRVEPSLGERTEEGELKFGTGPTRPLDCASADLLLGSDLAPHGIVSGSDGGGPLLGAHAIPTGLHIASLADLDAVCLENPGKSAPVDADLFSQLLNGDAARVAGDHVGHVNLDHDAAGLDVVPLQEAVDRVFADAMLLGKNAVGIASGVALENDLGGELRAHGAVLVPVVCDAPPVTGPVTVYNFSVQDDESYVAGGFVVHNCTCGPPMLYNPAIAEAVARTVARLRAAERK